MTRGKVSTVDPRQGSIGEWLFAPAPEALKVDRPLGDGLLALADVVLPIFEERKVCTVHAVAIRPIGGPDEVFPSLAATIAAVDAKQTALPTSEASVEVYAHALVEDGDEVLAVEDGVAICWRWIGEPVIQVKVYCDAYLPQRLDGSDNPLGPRNGLRLAAALAALQQKLQATVELGDDQMPWATGEGFLLNNR